MPQMRPFRVEAVDLDPACRELRVEGELDLAVVGQLRSHLDAAVEESLEILVCLGRCDFIDSSGIAAILHARKALAERERRLVVCEPSPAVRRVLNVAGLDRQSFLYASSEAALAERFGPAGSHPLWR